MSRPKRFGFNPLAMLAGIVKLAITVGLIVLVALLLWPPPVPQPVSDTAAAESFESAMERLLTAAEQRRPGMEAVSDHAVNAYLAARVAASDEAGTFSGLRVALRQIRLDFEQDRLRVTADTSYGPVRIVLMIEGRPVISDQGFSLKLEKTQVGRLPIPVRYGGWIADKVRSTVEGLEREREVLNRVRQIALEKGMARLTVVP